MRKNTKRKLGRPPRNEMRELSLMFAGLWVGVLMNPHPLRVSVSEQRAGRVRRRRGRPPKVVGMTLEAASEYVAGQFLDAGRAMRSKGHAEVLADLSLRVDTATLRKIEARFRETEARSRPPGVVCASDAAAAYGRFFGPKVDPDERRRNAARVLGWFGEDKAARWLLGDDRALH